MIMKLGTDMKFDVLYTMVTKQFVTLLLLLHYDVITCIWATCRPKFWIFVTTKALTDLAEIRYLGVFLGANFRYQVMLCF